MDFGSTQASLKREKRSVCPRFKRYKVSIFSVLSNYNFILDQPDLPSVDIEPFSRVECPKLGRERAPNLLYISNNCDIHGLMHPLPRSKMSTDSSVLPTAKNLPSSQHWTHMQRSALSRSVQHERS